MDYKISVIMPIYNAEKNLNQSIASIIQQSIGFENIELILVDDNSSDNSKDIIEDYANKFNNIIPYYSKENHGAPGFGRNIGIKNATAKYIMFIDNDDNYEKKMCETLYNAITNENADVVCCNTISKDSLGEIKYMIPYENHSKKGNKIIINNEDILHFYNTSIWNKIFKKEVVIKNQIKLLEDTWADDFAFCIEYFLKSKKLVYLEDYDGYYWNITSDSLSHVVKEKDIDILLYTYRYIYNKLINENKEKYMNKIIKSHLAYIILQCTYLESDKKNIKKNLAKIQKFELEIKFDLQLDPMWIEIFNKLIVNKHFEICFLIIKLIKFLRRSNLLKKIIRSF